MCLCESHANSLNELLYINVGKWKIILEATAMNRTLIFILFFLKGMFMEIYYHLLWLFSQDSISSCYFVMIIPLHVQKCVVHIGCLGISRHEIHVKELIKQFKLLISKGFYFGC